MWRSTLRFRDLTTCACVALVIIVAVVAEAAGTGQALSNPAPAAISWAEGVQSNSTLKQYAGECLQFVYLAYLDGSGVDIGTVGSMNGALDYWNTDPRKYVEHKLDRNPPVGGLVFWGATPYGPVVYPNSDGHVGIYVGNVPGYGPDEVVSTASWPESDGGPVHYFSLSARNAYGYPYLGWMAPPGVPNQAAGPQHVAYDVDGNGTSDLVSYDGSNLTVSGFSAGYPGFQQATQQSFQPFSWAGMGDVDGNGTSELVKYDGTHLTVSGFSAGYPGFSQVTSQVFPTFSWAGMGDVDGNGTSELVTYDDSQLSVWGYSPGYPGFSLITQQSFPGFVWARMGDVDGNGTSDLVTYDGSKLSVWGWSLGTPGFTQITQQSFLPFSWAGLGDVDGNGTADLAVYDGSHLSVWGYSPGYPGFQRSTDQSFVGVKWAALGDVDGNGTYDLITDNGSTLSVYGFSAGYPGFQLSTEQSFPSFAWADGSFLGTNGSGSAPLTKPSVTPSSVPKGTYRQQYLAMLSTTGAGSGPFKWRLTGGNLPRGLRLSSNGAIHGRARAVGNFRFSVSASKGTSTISSTITVTVEPAASPPSLRNGRVGRAYSEELRALGGTAPYVWSLAWSGLPPGLSLSSRGVISGTPTTRGTYVFTVKASDSTQPSHTVLKTCKVMVD